MITYRGRIMISKDWEGQQSNTQREQKFEVLRRERESGRKYWYFDRSIFLYEEKMKKKYWRESK